MLDRTDEVEQASPNLEAYRKELLDRNKQLAGTLTMLQQQVQQIVGQLNMAAGELKAVNRMLGRNDADTSA